MARAKKHTAEVERVRSYVEGVAKNLVDKVYGPDGPAWGTKLTEIEDFLLDLRQVLTEKMLDESLARQAAAQSRQAPATRRCPDCQEALACEDTNDRIVRTRAGEAEWAEPEGYCRQCRQAFFPSVQEPGD